jgi:hypothetical protein
VEDYLLHPVIHLDHHLFVLCRYDMLNPSPAESGLRDLRLEPFSVLTVALNEIEKKPFSFSDGRVAEAEAVPGPSVCDSSTGFSLRLRHAIESLLPPS